MDGTGLRFETLEHGGEYPDTMPQAIKLIDAEGRSCIYVPILQNGRVVDTMGLRSIPRMIDGNAAVASQESSARRRHASARWTRDMRLRS
jgi:hypothetical protein